MRSISISISSYILGFESVFNFVNNPLIFFGIPILLILISFDIDGLEPTLCPNTGTPVPGGLTWDMAIFLIRRLSESGKRIVGFDLCEVAIGNNKVDGWDAIVGARVLHKLCVAALVSRQG